MAAAAAEEEEGYRWETGYEKTWETLHEDDRGFLEPSVEEIIQKSKRARLVEKNASLKLGMMRHLFVIIDLSEAMGEQDFKPTRQICLLKILEGFVEAYCDNNPISQMGFVITHDKRAEKVSDMQGNPKKHIQVLTDLRTHSCVGEPSLQNSLQVAMNSLKNLPSHASREILIITASLTTCDPGNIEHTIEDVHKNSIRVCVIGLCAELHVYRSVSRRTGGTYHVALDEHHFKELIHYQLDPPPAVKGMDATLMRMGFPKSITQDHQIDNPAMCMCHLDSKEGSVGFGTFGYLCPRCQSKYCSLPVECKCCGLTLVSAPHLARSYHHLFPLKPFTELDHNSDSTAQQCTGCDKIITEKKMYMCPVCECVVCLDCDLFIHDIMHTCPGCTVNPM